MYRALKYSFWHILVTHDTGFFWNKSYHFNGKLLSRLMNIVKSHQFENHCTSCSLNAVKVT